MLKSLHREANDPIDWNAIRNTPKPVQPEYSDTKEAIAQKLLDNFKPTV
ncbi:hypothetical protein JKG61_22830, partial [Sphingobacterium sp. C459-1T]|nr:hypothetical protein [Sphingobacterium faecale]